MLTTNQFVTINNKLYNKLVCHLHFNGTEYCAYELYVPEAAYTQNRSGPRTEPWGTPHVRGATEEEALPIITEKFLFDK